MTLRCVTTSMFSHIIFLYSAIRTPATSIITWIAPSIWLYHQQRKTYLISENKMLKPFDINALFSSSYTLQTHRRQNISSAVRWHQHRTHVIYWLATPVSRAHNDAISFHKSVTVSVFSTSILFLRGNVPSSF